MSDSAESIDTLPAAEIRRRLREVHAATAHLRRRLDPDSPHNTLVKIADIALFIQVANPSNLTFLMHEAPPSRCFRGCGSVSACKLKPRCRPIPERWHRDLSAFFIRWERGELVKAKTPAGWRIVARDGAPGVAQMAPAPLAKADARPPFSMRIDMNTLGLRLKER